MRFTLSATLLLLLLPCTALSACCVWDNDLLEDELLPWPDALSIMSGRIERQPPEYHMAKLAKLLPARDGAERIADLLAAATALDQLDRQHEALELLLPLLDEPLTPADRTRVRGMLAQCYLHLWWLGDAKQTATFRLTEAKRHVAGLPRASLIESIIEWAGQTERAQPDSMLPDMFKLRWAGNKIAIKATTQLADRGLEGAADMLLALLQRHHLWENFDTLYALSLVWAVDGRQPLAHMARARAWQLHQQGRGSRVPGAGELYDVRPVTLVRQPRDHHLKDMTPLEPRYRLALEECMAAYHGYALAWQHARTEHAQNWLARGHAADDPALWADFKPPLPKLPPLPRPVLEATEPPAQAGTDTVHEPAIAEPEPQDNTLLLPLLGAIALLLAAGFFVNSRVERKLPEEAA